MEKKLNDNNFIEIKGLNKYYSNESQVVVGLKNIDLSLNIGEFIAITGASGSGKTTLLNVISGMDTYNDGYFMVGGKDVNTFTPIDYENYRRNSVRFIFQNYNLIDSFTVYENVAIAFDHQDIDKTTKDTKIKELLKEVFLENMKDKKVSYLSGGEKQRVAIARALASDAQILACDEPTGNLDSENSKKIVEILKRLSNKRLVLYVTHDIKEIQDVATRVIKMHDGQIVYDKIQKEVVKEEFTPLEDKPLVEKTFKVSNRLLLSTPRRFVLWTLILFISTLSFGIIYQMLFNQSASSNSDYYKNSFSNSYDERIVVKNSNFEPFTVEQLETMSRLEHVNGVIKNDLGLDNSFMIDDDSFYYQFFYFRSKNLIKNQRVSVGKFATNEDEIVIQNDFKYSGIHDEDLLNRSLKFKNNRNENKVYEFKVTGILHGSRGYIFASNSKIDEIGNDLLLSKLTLNVGDVELTDLKVVFDDTLDSNMIKIKRNGSAYVPYNPTKITFKCPFFSFEIKDPTVEVSHGDFYDYSYVVSCNKSLFQEYIDKSYEVTIDCTSASNVETLTAELESKGFLALPILKTKSSVLEITNFISNIFKTIFSFILLLLIAFLSYISLKNIVMSESKSFQTLRALGFSRKGILKILIHQFIGVTIICFLIYSILFPIVIYLFSSIPLIANMRYNLFDAFILLCAMSFLCFELILKYYKFISKLNVSSKILE